MRIPRREFLRVAGVTGAGLVLPGCYGRGHSHAPAAEIAPPELSAEELCAAAIRAARKSGADYSDVRLGRYRTQTLYARDRRVGHVEDSASYGFGIRVLVRGGWGFAASGIVTPPEIERVAALATRIARASAGLLEEPVSLVPEPVHRDIYRSPREQDPFVVGLDTKADLLLASHETLLAHPDVAVAESYLGAWHRIQHFASSEGSRIETDLVRTWGNLEARAVGDGDSQSRYCEASPRHAGWEHILATDFPGQAERLAREASEKLKAAEGPQGKYDLILDPQHLCLTLHETIGHPSELDRALGFEANYAGTSFLTPDQLGKLKYGSSHVSITADNVLPVGLASIGYDDDGVKCQRWPIVRDGVFVGYSTNREVAAEIDESRSRGSCRADSWSSIPIVRISNIGLEPGEGNVDDLIRDTKRGIYIAGRGTYSIDQKRYNFQFGGDMFWLIENGRKVRPLKNVIYQGITPEFWGSCDAVCDRAHWEPFGVLNCGKGEPSQAGQMTHGASHARFRAVRVGGSDSGGRA